MGETTSKLFLMEWLTTTNCFLMELNFNFSFLFQHHVIRQIVRMELHVNLKQVLHCVFVWMVSMVTDVNEVGS